MDSSPPAAVSQSPNPPADNFEDVMALFEGDNQGQEYPDNELYLLAEEVASSYSPQPSVVYVFVCQCMCVCGGGRSPRAVGLTFPLFLLLKHRCQWRRTGGD